MWRTCLSSALPLVCSGNCFPLRSYPCAVQVILSHTPMQQLVPRLRDRPVLVSGRGRVLDVARHYGFGRVLSTYQLGAAMPTATPFASYLRDAGVNRSVGGEAGGARPVWGCQEGLLPPAEYKNLGVIATNAMSCVLVTTRVCNSNKTRTHVCTGTPYLTLAILPPL